MASSTFSGPVTSLAGFISGTSAAPVALTAAGNLGQSYATTSAATGDTRLSYQKLTFSSTGSGETARNFTVVTGVGAATGGTVNGGHMSLSIDGAGTVSGAGNAVRATLGGTSTNPGGTLASLQLDSDFATGGTWSNASFMRVTNSGTGVIDNFALLPTTGAGLMVAPHTTQVMTDSIRIKLADGTTRYIMLTTLATNRS